MKKFLVAALAATLCLSAFTGCGSKVEKNLKLGTYETDVEDPDPDMPAIVLKEDNKFDIVYKGAADKNISGTYEINKNDEIVCTADSTEQATGEDGTTEEAATYIFTTTDDYNLVFLGISDNLPTLANTEFVSSYVANNQEFDYADDYYSDDDE